MCIRNGPADIAKKYLQLGKSKGTKQLEEKETNQLKKGKKIEEKRSKNKVFFFA